MKFYNLGHKTFETDFNRKSFLCQSLQVDESEDEKERRL